jgi:hypothetical protein
VASLPTIGRRERRSDEPPRRAYVASLIWPGRLPAPANDNGAPACGARLTLALAALALVAAVWGVT